MKKNFLLLLVAVSMFAVLLFAGMSRGAEEPMCTNDELGKAVIYIPFEGTECEFIEEMVRYCDLMDTDVIYVTVEGMGDLTMDCNVFRAMVYEANKPFPEATDI